MNEWNASNVTGVVAVGFDDHSNSFGQLRPHLRNSADVSLIDFVRALKPNYRVVYYDIAWGHGALALTLVAAIAAELAGVPKLAVAGIGFLLVGYWIAYLQLFLHEGAHWNLAPDREKSDRICNLGVGWLAGIDVKRYRKIHFQHHRALGTTEDSEHTYFFPLNLLFLIKGLFGIRAVEVLLVRKKVEAALDNRSSLRSASDSAAKEPVIDSQLLLGAAIHLGIIVTLAAIGLWASAAAWLLGVAMMFPFLGALRTLLEHRDENASAKLDYRVTDHGPVARMFGDGPLASTFGGAGFNRHLLHHWEPTVSYTRLKDLEAFLADTPLKGVMEQRTTTYGRIFIRLFRQALSPTQAN